MTRLTILLAAFSGLIGCMGSDPESSRSLADDAPRRIVSLDYCADQFVLKFAERDAIRAVSPDADKPFSYMREAAAGLPKVRPNAEDVLVLQPDLVVRSYGGGPNAAAFFERAGIPVLQVGFAGSLDDVKDVVADMAAGLGNVAGGEMVIAEMDERLAAIRKREAPPEALYMTPAGVTTGPGTQVDEMLRAAGLDNFQTEPGWRALPLERLAYEQPDVVAVAFIERLNSQPDAWSPIRHPVARRQINDLPMVPLEGAWTSCGSWFLVDAIEALADFDRAPADTEHDGR